ncbi:hypothetical protein VNO77_39633 [Canavalia gladiata]|uniref:Uncharacterized protein n=1 Tax=Canavalia gladiata TaxID=3824 RepID=A0AAN9JZ43_CANGL
MRVWHFYVLVSKAFIYDFKWVKEKYEGNLRTYSCRNACVVDDDMGRVLSDEKMKEIFYMVLKASWSTSATRIPE